jgi:hypothetical protein
LQVTDLFFRLLFAFFIMEKGHAIWFGILIANSGRILRAWPPRVASRCFEPRIGHAPGECHL